MMRIQQRRLLRPAMASIRLQRANGHVVAPFSLLHAPPAAEERFAAAAAAAAATPTLPLFPSSFGRSCFFSTQQAANDSDEEEEAEEVAYNNSDTNTTTTTEDAFRIFQLPHQFRIDEDALKQSYRQLMAELHPDKHHHAQNTTTTNDASLTASQVTRAYDRLKNVHTRAAHLMEMLGRPMEEATSGALVGCEFLMQVMLLREMIDDAGECASKHHHQQQNSNDDESSSGGCSNSEGGCPNLKDMWEENQERIEDTCQELERMLEEGNLDKAREMTARLQYWNRIDETIRERMDCFD